MDEKFIILSLESIRFQNPAAAYANLLALKKWLENDLSDEVRKKIEELENLFSEKMTHEEWKNLRRRIDRMFASPKISDFEPIRREVKLPKKEAGTNLGFFPLAEKSKKRRKKEKPRKVKKGGQPKISSRKSSGHRVNRCQKMRRR